MFSFYLKLTYLAELSELKMKCRNLFKCENLVATTFNIFHLIKCYYREFNYSIDLIFHLINCFMPTFPNRRCSSKCGVFVRPHGALCGDRVCSAHWSLAHLPAAAPLQRRARGLPARPARVCGVRVHVPLALLAVLIW